MCGGGGGFLGTVLSIASYFVPVLAPIAIAYNANQAYENDNVLGMIGAGLGAAGAFGAFGGAAGASGNIASDIGSSFGSGVMGGVGSSLGGSIASGLADTSSIWGDAAMGLSTGLGNSAGVAASSTPAGTAWDNMFTSGMAPQDSLNAELGTNQYTADNLPSYFQGLNPEGLNKFYTGTQNLATTGAGAESTLASGTSGNVPGLTPSLSSATETFDPQVSAMSQTDPNTYGDLVKSGETAFKPPTDSGLGIQGSSPNYSWQDKSFMGTPTGTGIEAGASPEISNLNLANAGPQNAAEYAFKQPQGFNMGSLNNLFTMKNAGTLMKGLGGVDSYLKQKQALEQLKALQQGSDPYAADRSLASNKWQEITQNPEAAWQQYIGGQGKDFMQNAAAKYAGAGRRNMLPTLMNQAHQQYLSSYLPSYKASVNPNQFASTANNPTALGGSIANLQANQNAPLYSAATSLLGNSDVQKSLSDLFSGWF